MSIGDSFNRGCYVLENYIGIGKTERSPVVVKNPYIPGIVKDFLKNAIKKTSYQQTKSIRRRVMSRDKLSIDVMNDLRKVDGFMNKLINDKRSQQRFFKNPSKVMIELGFHPPTTKRAMGITNRVFYLTLTNKKLIRHCIDKMPQFEIPKDLEKKTLAALDRGRIKVDPMVDEIILKAYLKDEKHLRTMFLLSLTDLNRKRVFSKRFTDKEIHAYVEKVLLRIRKRRPIREMPVLDRFGPRYGVGFVGEGDADAGGVCFPSDVDTEADAGGVCFPSDVEVDGGAEADSGSNAASTVEVGAWASAAAATEIIAVATVAIPVFVLGISPVLFDQMVDTYPSDRPRLKAIATMAKLFSFASDLALHAQNLERHGSFGKA